MKNFKWQHIQFTDGCNPYICTTEKNFKWMQKHYNLIKIKDGFWLAEKGFMTVREQISDCFQSCKVLEDSYRISVDSTYSIFVLVQEDPDYENLEYFIELNKTVDGADEPCAEYNTSCPIDNLYNFEQVIINYLENNGISV